MADTEHSLPQVLSALCALTHLVITIFLYDGFYPFSDKETEELS